MSNALAQTLLRLGAVPREQLDAAIQNQVVHGGSLDTSLLELDLINETNLLDVMGEAYGLPVIRKEDIDQVPPHIPRLFPLVFAESYRIVPYALSGQSLHALIHSIPDQALFDRIHERLHLKVEPVITSELRLHYAMHRLYGTTLLPRMIQILTRLDGQTPQTEQTSDRALSWGVSGRKIEQASKGPPSRADMSGFLARIEGAEDRDAVVDILLEATLGTFAFAGIFLMQGKNALGWRSSDPKATQALTQVSIPLDVPSVFTTIQQTRGHYLGPLPDDAFHQGFVRSVERELPRTAFLAPITVGGKLAAILYADNGTTGVPSKRVASILVLTHRAGVALESLIRNRRKIASSPQTPNAAPVEAMPGPAEDIIEIDDSEFEVIPEEVEIVDDPLPERSMDDDEWESVSFDDFQPGSATGRFEQDASPDTAAAAFARSVKQATKNLEEVEIDVDDLEVDASDDYVAFADISEDGEASVEDWEDVLVDTAAEPEAPAAAPAMPRAPGSVTWNAVIELALSPPELTIQEAEEEVEVAGAVVNEKEMLLDSLEASDPEVRRGAIERLMHLGSAIDEDLHRRFPGEVTFDPFAEGAALQAFSQCSGLAALLEARGPSASGVVAPHLDSQDPIRRFFALYFFRTVVYAPAIEGIARRLYDSEPRNRYMAADALRRYATDDGYQTIMEGLREHLAVPLIETQVTTAQIFGQLREPTAVPSLIPMLRSGNALVVQAVASALAVICAQNFGNDIDAWSQWWRDHYREPREAWLVQGLRHPADAIQKLAFRELQACTGMARDIEPEGSDAAREEAIKAWEAWWERTSAPMRPSTQMSA